MKFLTPQILAFVHNRTARRNVKLLLKYVVLLLALITLFSVLFHFIMLAEGQRFSWLTGFYWTLTVMTTLGFGDITFATDLGKAFSIVVMMSGVFFLLVVFPFTFIHFFYQPWLESRDRYRTLRELPETMRDHFILVGDDPLVLELVTRLKAMEAPYALVVPDAKTGLELAELEITVMVGAPDDALTWASARVDKARVVIAAADDFLNTNIAFTVRELSADVHITALARSVDSVDVLELAGANHVIHLAGLLGEAIGRLAYGGKHRATKVGEIDGLTIAEAPMMHSELVGRSLLEAGFRAEAGVVVVGVWEKGVFALPHRETVIHDETVLLLAGPEENLARFDALAGGRKGDVAPVVILGAGRVGRIAALALRRRGIDYRVVDLKAARATACDPDRFILGSAADLGTLEKAGIRKTPTVVITTGDDATNVYLTIYCRRLRPDVQIIARANLERNVGTMHRAGANLVLGYTALGSSAILNQTDVRSPLYVAEGLELFRCTVPAGAPPRPLSECRFREEAGCNVLAIQRGDEQIVAPSASAEVRPGDRLVLAGMPDSRRRLDAALAKHEDEDPTD